MDHLGKKTHNFFVCEIVCFLKISTWNPKYLQLGSP